MSNPTYIKLTGWVTKDPELRRTNNNNTPVCTIRLGTANRWPDRNTGEWREGPASYFDVVCWRALAVNVAASLRKGHMVTIHGTFRNRIWTDKDNNDRTALEITASSVGHELTYGWSHFNRTQRASSSAEGELAVGEASRGIEPGELDEESGPPEMSPFDERYESAGDEGGADGAEDDEGGADDAGTSETAADSPRLAEVAVPA
ncbi:MAG TPA: single-stranded DNA-binding protein [Trebonia sp.]